MNLGKDDDPMTVKRSVFYIDERKNTASTELAHLLEKCIEKVERPWDEIVFVCIGSDRITGDSLGPMVGHQLSRYRWKDFYVYGTLDCPVHALNLENTLDELKERHPSALYIAVDASLGSQKHVGFISIGTGSIYPGAGVHKSLPPVGDIFITGILNVSGTFEHFLLQTTRLSSVVQMAETITAGIEETFTRTYEKRRLLPDEWFHPEERKRRLCWANDTGLAALSIESSSGIIS